MASTASASASASTESSRRESFASDDYGVRNASGGGSWSQLVKRALHASLQLVLLLPRALRFVLRVQKGREAPVVRGSLLWGSAIAFREDAVGLLQRTSAALGPAFTFRLFSYWVTLLADARALAHVEAHPQLSFDPIPKQANQNVYRFPTRNADLLLTNARRAGTGSMLNSNLHTFGRSLREALDSLLAECSQPAPATAPARAAGATRPSTLTRSTSGDARSQAEVQCGLYKLLERTLFVGIFEGLFGRWPEQTGFTARQFKGPLDTLRRYFNLLYIGLPHWLFPEANRAMRQLATQPTPEQFFEKSDAAEFTKTALRAMRADGQSAEDCAGHNLVLLHVNDTTFRFGFWLMYYLIAHPDALAKVVEEVDAFVEHHTSADGEVHIPLSELRANSQMPYLESAVWETLRLCSGVFVMRVATASTQVQSGGRAYNVREGDRVAMYAPLAHYDPSVFDAPDEFRVERFLAAADSAAAGVAGGATVRPEERLFPFGARCPGKHMALMQVRLSAVMLLSQLRDVHLLPGERTQLDRTHCGHEILPPTRDPLVAFTPRSRPLAFNLVD